MPKEFVAFVLFLIWVLGLGTLLAGAYGGIFIAPKNPFEFYFMVVILTIASFWAFLILFIEIIEP